MIKKRTTIESLPGLEQKDNKRNRISEIEIFFTAKNDFTHLYFPGTSAQSTFCKDCSAENFIAL